MDPAPNTSAANPGDFQQAVRRDPILGEVLRRLVDVYRPERVYLFGSKARGDHSVDSDYDLMLVMPNSAPPEMRRSRLAYEALWGVGAAVDVLIRTRQQFDGRVHLKASLPATVLRDGILLYAS